MAYELNGPVYGGWTAGADYSTSGQHRFVTVASGAVTLTGAGLRADGVLRNDPASGGAAEVGLPGTIQRIEAGAVFAINADIASDATGRAVTADEGDIVLGKALAAAGAAGEIVSILTYPGGAAGEGPAAYNTIAAADYSTAGANRFVILDGTDATLVAAAGALAHGVLQNAPASGAAAQVTPLGGIMGIELGATVAAGVDIMSADDGQAIAATGTGAYRLGRTLEGGDATDVVSCLTFSGGGGQLA